MPEIPEELITTDKLLYIEGLDRKSQVPLMRQLAQIAQELYNKYPEFCALIPFWSRTKGLSFEETADIDIFVVIDFENDPASKILHMIEKYCYEILKEKGIDKDKTHLKAVDIREYEILLSSWHLNYGPAFSPVLGTVLGPHRLDAVLKKIKKHSQDKKEEILARLLFDVFESEKVAIIKKYPENQLVSSHKLFSSYMQNRLRLWERRIRNLLHLKVEKKD